MTKLSELEKLADAATPGPWEAEFDPYGDRAYRWPTISASNGKEIIGTEGLYSELDTDIANAQFIAAANPETIKEMIALCRLQHETLKDCTGYCLHQWQYVKAREALAAYEAFEKGE